MNPIYRSTMVNLPMEGPFVFQMSALFSLTTFMDIPSSCVGAVGNRNRTSSSPSRRRDSPRIECGIVGGCHYHQLVGGWPTPLKNDGLRQLGWWHFQLNGKIKVMFQTTNQSIFGPPKLQYIGALPISGQHRRNMKEQKEHEQPEFSGPETMLSSTTTQGYPKLYLFNILRIR